MKGSYYLDNIRYIIQKAIHIIKTYIFTQIESINNEVILEPNAYTTMKQLEI